MKLKALWGVSLVCGLSAVPLPALADCDPTSPDYRYCLYQQFMRASGPASRDAGQVSSRSNPLGGYDYSNGVSSRSNPLGGYGYSNGVRCRPNPLGGMDCGR